MKKRHGRVFKISELSARFVTKVTRLRARFAQLELFPQPEARAPAIQKAGARGRQLDSGQLARFVVMNDASTIGVERPVVRAQPPPAYGLVSIPTSHMLEDGFIRVNRQETRLRGMKCAVKTAGRLIESGLQMGGFRYRAAMLTATYAHVDA